MRLLISIVVCDKIPWKLCLFIFVVFYLSTPFDITYSRDVGPALEMFDAPTALTLVREGNIGRRIALFSLLGVGLITLAKCRRRVMPIGILPLLLVSLALWAALSISWAEDPTLTVRRLFVLWFVAGSALCFAIRLTTREIAQLTFFVCGATLLLSIIAEVAVSTFHPFREGYRFAGVMHPVSQGWNCGLLVISSFDLFKKEKRGRFTFLIIFFIAIIFLLFTRSRMPLASTLVGLLVYWLLTMPGWTIISSLGGILTVACISYFIIGDFIFHHADYFVHLGRGEAEMAGTKTLTGRTDLWRECLTYIAERPLTGYGYESFLTPRFFIRISRKTNWIPSSAHSGFIQVLLGLGLVGAGLFVAILFTALKRAFLLSAWSKDYVFLTTVLVWYCCNLVLEGSILTEPVFPAFLSMIVLANLGFVGNPKPSRI